jgi:purine-binding chemotaxis protein CheW
MKSSNRYICFSLGAENFAIPLLAVREVIGVPQVTPVPQTPSYFLGIMNLRGLVISVMDLRLKMSIKPKGGTEETVMILDLGKYNLGVLVDQITEVVEVDEKTLAQKPQVESSKIVDAIKGVFRKDEKLILVLDIAKALSIEDQAALKTHTDQKAG